MRYRLPLELELTILELAAPPLAMDSLHERVDFFIKISLVHRSFTAWAQDRLRDQFLYTYRPRPDEHERLKQRFEAGFGRNRPLRRLYLDLSRLPQDINGRTAPGTDSVSATVYEQVYWPVSPTSGSSDPEQVASKAQEQECEAVAHYEEYDPAQEGQWQLCTMITAYSQALDTLRLRLPFVPLDIADLPSPRILYIDDSACDDTWGGFALIPDSSRTVLFLQGVTLCPIGDGSDLSTRQLVFDRCSEAAAFVGELLPRFPHLETLVLSEMKALDFLQMLYRLPTSIRRVHILQPDMNYEHPEVYDVPIVLPHLESFTFTLLTLAADQGPKTPADGRLKTLAVFQDAVEAFVEALVEAPRCTYRFLYSTKSPKSALEDALAAFKLDL